MPGEGKQLDINFSRLKRDINELGSIGKAEENRGIYRMAFSDADMRAREWLTSKIQEAGLVYYIDGAANIYAKLNENENKPSVLIGSHIDTVPAGGHLDGAFGVLGGLECLRRMKEEGIQTEYPVELVSFTDEEGRFGGLFGSQSVCGEITPEKIHNSVDLDGIGVIEAMKAHGLNANDALHARRRPGTIHAYLELHIEQGPVLDRLDIPIGIVEHITGLFKWNVRLIGKANHAGTTPMNMREDAFQGLAEFSGEINRVLEEKGSENSVATIGKVNLYPGTANVVPGIAEFSLDVRDPNTEILQSLSDSFRTTLSAIARRRKLMFEFDVLSEIQPEKCDSEIVRIVQQAAEQRNVARHRMFSGSVHDALVMASITRIGMIMVPSVKGISHSPEEWTAWEDLETGTNVALDTLLKVSGAQI